MLKENVLRSNHVLFTRYLSELIYICILWFFLRKIKAKKRNLGTSKFYNGNYRMMCNDFQLSKELTSPTLLDVHLIHKWASSSLVMITWYLTIQRSTLRGRSRFPEVMPLAWIEEKAWTSYSAGSVCWLELLCKYINSRVQLLWYIWGCPCHGWCPVWCLRSLEINFTSLET